MGRVLPCHSWAHAVFVKTSLRADACAHPAVSGLSMNLPRRLRKESALMWHGPPSARGQEEGGQERKNY